MYCMCFNMEGAPRLLCCIVAMSINSFLLEDCIHTMPGIVKLSWDSSINFLSLNGEKVYCISSIVNLPISWRFVCSIVWQSVRLFSSLKFVSYIHICQIVLDLCHPMTNYSQTSWLDYLLLAYCYVSYNQSVDCRELLSNFCYCTFWLLRSLYTVYINWNLLYLELCNIRLWPFLIRVC